MTILKNWRKTYVCLHHRQFREPLTASYRKIHMCQLAQNVHPLALLLCPARTLLSSKTTGSCELGSSTTTKPNMIYGSHANICATFWIKWTISMILTLRCRHRAPKLTSGSALPSPYAYKDNNCYLMGNGVFFY